MNIVSSTCHRGIIEDEFELKRAERLIPGILWRPDVTIPRGLVLIGHGGSGSKRESHVVALARALVRGHAFAALAIDGPVHGARRGERSDAQALVMLDFSQVWASDPDMTDAMINDWSAAIDSALDHLDLDHASLGYWGLSMGTILGLPLVAHDQRITACVLGLAGLTGPTADRLDADASRVTCPTFFVMQLGDELFDRNASLSLFDALGAPDKQLHATPGRHSAVTDETFRLSVEFLVDRMTNQS